MFYVILLSYLFPNFSKSIVIHVKETCCPCMVKIHVNNIQVTSWPCSLLILCHIKILAGDQCQVHFHLANQLYLFYLVSDLLSTLPDICNHLYRTFFFFFFFFLCDFYIFRNVPPLVHVKDLVTSKGAPSKDDFIALMHSKLDINEIAK